MLSLFEKGNENDDHKNDLSGKVDKSFNFAYSEIKVDARGKGQNCWYNIAAICPSQSGVALPWRKAETCQTEGTSREVVSGFVMLTFSEFFFCFFFWICFVFFVAFFWEKVILHFFKSFSP